MAREYAIATASSRTAKKWRNQTLTWEAITDRVKKPVRTGETVAEYKRMSKDEKDKRKDQGGFVGGYLQDGLRKRENVKSRSLLCLDADDVGDADFPGKVRSALEGVTYLIYTTHSHTPEAPRYRLIVPLSEDIEPEKYEPIARRITYRIGIDMFDPTTYDINRLMHWPSTPKDGVYEHLEADGELLNPSEILSAYRDWKDATAWPIGKAETAARQKEVKKLGDPREKPGLVGLFCRAYSIEEAIAAYLPRDYIKCDTAENRYTYAQGTTTGGVIVYDDGLHAYSHHSTDPISGQDVNAFDLVRLAKYGLLDDDDDKPVTKRESYKAMQELCAKDERVRRLQNESLAASFSDDLLEGDTDWLMNLQRTKQGAIVSSVANIILILENDPRIKGAIGFDDFAKMITVRSDLPWRKLRKGLDRDVWIDSDDAQLRNFISMNYEGLTGRQVIYDALQEIVSRHSYNPVLEYFDSLKWDGVPRIETLLIDYLGAEDTSYTREITTKFFKAAVIRAKHPGTKFDYCLVLAGPQGIGKSTVLQRMGHKWFNDTIANIHGKDAMEQLVGTLVVELGEMQAANRSENEELKAYISRTCDKFRPAYGRRTEEFKRTCIFAATTNEKIFLKDLTGGRRFWIVPCEGDIKKDISLFTREEADQCWAELLHICETDRSIFPSKETLSEGARIQESKTEGSEKIGLIEAFLEIPIPKDWYSRTATERRAYCTDWQPADDSGEGTEELEMRDKVCALEIWHECYGMTGQMKNIDARGINSVLSRLEGWEPYYKGGRLRFGCYGLQRCYVRKKSAYSRLKNQDSVTSKNDDFGNQNETGNTEDELI